MLKCWLTYDASLLGSHTANMTTYALYIIVIFLINNFYDELETPLDVFKKFFEFFSDFDWNSKILTIYGPVSFSSNKKNLDEQALNERQSNPLLQDRTLLVEPSHFKEKHVQYDQVRKWQCEQSSKSGKDLHQIWAKPLKIADPCIPSNNLGKSMSL